MTETEFERILKSLDAALEVFTNRDGALTAPEISVKSMLMALRKQVAAQLMVERITAKT